MTANVDTGAVEVLLKCEEVLASAWVSHFLPLSISTLLGLKRCVQAGRSDVLDLLFPQESARHLVAWGSGSWLILVEYHVLALRADECATSIGKSNHVLSMCARVRLRGPIDSYQSCLLRVSKQSQQWLALCYEALLSEQCYQCIPVSYRVLPGVRKRSDSAATMIRVMMSQRKSYGDLYYAPLQSAESSSVQYGDDTWQQIIQYHWITIQYSEEFPQLRKMIPRSLARTVYMRHRDCARDMVSRLHTETHQQTVDASLSAFLCRLDPAFAVFAVALQRAVTVPQELIDLSATDWEEMAVDIPSSVLSEIRSAAMHLASDPAPCNATGVLWDRSLADWLSSISPSYCRYAAVLQTVATVPADLAFLQPTDWQLSGGIPTVTMRRLMSCASGEPARSIAPAFDTAASQLGVWQWLKQMHPEYMQHATHLGMVAEKVSDLTLLTDHQLNQLRIPIGTSRHLKALSQCAAPAAQDASLRVLVVGHPLQVRFALPQPSSTVQFSSATAFSDVCKCVAQLSPVHVLVIVSHGDDDKYSWRDDTHRLPDNTRPRGLADLIAAHPTLRVVVLLGCNSEPLAAECNAILNRALCIGTNKHVTMRYVTEWLRLFTALVVHEPQEPFSVCAHVAESLKLVDSELRWGATLADAKRRCTLM